MEGDVLYVREELLRQYVGERAVVWYSFGERELRPFPPTPPDWLVSAQQKQENAWVEVLTQEDVLVSSKTRGKAATRKRKPAPKSGIRGRPVKKQSKQVRAKTARRAGGKISK
jgi:hypothetical protein